MVAKRTSLVQSKVARRMLLLFVGCALLPMAAVALVVMTRGSARLEEESHRQLRRVAKARGLWMYERLQLLDSELELAGYQLRTDSTEAAASKAVLHFVSLAVTREGAEPVSLVGDAIPQQELTKRQRAHLESGKPLIRILPGPHVAKRVWLGRSVASADGISSILWGEIQNEFLFETESLPESRRLCVLDEESDLVSSSTADWMELRSALVVSTSSRSFDWYEDGEPFVAAGWQLFLDARFGSPGWIVVMSEDRESLLAPIAVFEEALALIAFLAALVVTLLSIAQIRRTLGPIEVLRAATRRLRERDFTARAVVSSGDEFEELADSFNSMAERVGHQFGVLSTLSEVQRSILAAFQAPDLVEQILPRLPEMSGCGACAIALFRAETQQATAQIRDASGEIHVQRGPFEDADRELFNESGAAITVSPEDWLPHLFRQLRTGKRERFVLIPVHYDGALAAVVALGYDGTPSPDVEDVAHIQQLAEQMVIGLEHSQLVRELSRITWGTLTALARAIDAKSPWTMGHSERVMDVACAIGRDFGLSQAGMRTLRRGALLHDIGKIGIPARILEKTDSLTEEEFDLMRGHAMLGVRILEPITAFADAIPIVMEHHERMDGSGYPMGLVGEAISIYARIVAVADCFDALRSDRPYRSGMADQDVMDLIRSESPDKFDPDAVASLERILKRGQVPAMINVDPVHSARPPADIWSIT